MVLGVTDLSPAEYLERYQRGLEKHARGTSPDPEAYEHWGCHAASSDIRHWSISLLKNKKHFKKPGAEFSRAAHTSSDAMKFDASSVASLVTSQRLAPSRSPWISLRHRPIWNSNRPDNLELDSTRFTSYHRGRTKRRRSPYTHRLCYSRMLCLAWSPIQILQVWDRWDWESCARTSLSMLYSPEYISKAASVLFDPKKDGKLRFCVDSRALNKQTVRSYFPFPNLTSWLTRLKVLDSFLYLISCLCTRGQNIPTQDCLFYPIWSFWIPRRSLWTHERSLDVPDCHEHFPGTLISFLFTSMTSWSSAGTTKNSTLKTMYKCWQSWETINCTQGRKNAISTRDFLSFWDTSAPTMAFDPLQNKLIALNSCPASKTWIHCSYSWDLCTSSEVSSQLSLQLLHLWQSCG